MEAIISNCNILSEVSLFREKMNKHNFIFSYRGKMSHGIAKNLLSLTEKKISALNEDGSIKKKIFGVMINCLQTICSNDESIELNQETLFMINKTETGYTIVNGIHLKPSHSIILRTMLDEINQMSNESLSELRKEKLIDLKSINDSFSIDEVTLSLINIAKKSGEKINYQIENVESDKDFLSLQIHIS